MSWHGSDIFQRRIDNDNEYEGTEFIEAGRSKLKRRSTNLICREGTEYIGAVTGYGWTKTNYKLDVIFVGHIVGNATYQDCTETDSIFEAFFFRFRKGLQNCGKMWVVSDIERGY